MHCSVEICSILWRLTTKKHRIIFRLYPYQKISKYLHQLDGKWKIVVVSSKRTVAFTCLPSPLLSKNISPELAHSSCCDAPWLADVKKYINQNLLSKIAGTKATLIYQFPWCEVTEISLQIVIIRAWRLRVGLSPSKVIYCLWWWFFVFWRFRKKCSSFLKQDKDDLHKNAPLWDPSNTLTMPFCLEIALQIVANV